MKKVFVMLLLLVITITTMAEDKSGFTSYEKALDLVHAYSGSGPELQQAMHIAEELAKAEPKSGYFQVLYAEALSTWSLRQDGRPSDIRDQVIKLSDEALHLNPNFAQAHVSKARALVRASMYKKAEESINAALSIDPKLSGAIFLQAEIFRRLEIFEEADKWYRKFIASTPSNSRKSNGYGWLATMYSDAVSDDEKRRAEFIVKAREAFENCLRLDPSGAWRNVNFAIFLNGHAGDFDAAEKYAKRALSMMEFPMARYHLAAARYQKLAKAASIMSRVTLENEIKKINKSTGISLEEACAFDGFEKVVTDRLLMLQRKI